MKSAQPPFIAVLLAVFATALAQADTPPASVTAPAVARPTENELKEPVPALVVLKDGQQLRGKLVAQDDTGATIELEGGSRLFVPAVSIERIDLASAGQTEVRSRDPNRTRYLYSPSGFMLKRGEGYVSQTELLLTSVAYGLTDHVTVGLGTTIPTLFVNGGALLVGTLRIGTEVSESFHLAAGSQGFFHPASRTISGFLFGTATVGTPEGHVSVSAGPSFVTSTNQNELGVSANPPFGPGTNKNGIGDVIVVGSGNVRASEHIALVSENWFMLGEYDTILFSGAVRVIGQRMGVDVGFILMNHLPIPMPWLDFTWNFGAR